MDIQTPVMDGRAAARRIRKLEKEKNLEEAPALTVHALKGERRLNAGRADCITKPVEKEKPLNLIEKFSGNKKAVRGEASI